MKGDIDAAFQNAKMQPPCICNERFLGKLLNENITNSGNCILPGEDSPPGGMKHKIHINRF